ncbi:MAG: tRNA (adenosine(37)-N6)-threonylcarbamoyltransferase complex ATPase subunit type 1 TsaE [bacterium]|nr:tRNA (adenosine(37)-N6)-threonylcarbamoyltransferase complex ATPase subunit type 1 TsaE [bacterium]
MRTISHSPEETAAVASDLLHRLGRGPRARVLGLRGNLGAGKTTFTQALAKSLGVGEIVTSPTFVIEKVYQLAPNAPFHHLVHIDAYRLESPAELAHLGFDDLLADAGNLMVVEWPERVAELLPPNTIMIDFTFINDHTREIIYAD